MQYASLVNSKDEAKRYVGVRTFAQYFAQYCDR